MGMPTGTRNDVVADVLKVELLWTQGGVPAANILHFAYSGGPPSGTDCATLAKDVANALWATVGADYPSTTVLVAAKGTDLNTLAGASGTESLGHVGTAVDGPSPAAACVLVDWQITRRYRGGHPRTYFPAVAFGAIATPSTWNPDIITDFTTAIDTVLALDGVATSGTTVLGQLVNVSYVTADAWRVANVVDSIYGFSVSSLIRSQRRRTTATTY
jgi:hypothetical protein